MRKDIPEHVVRDVAVAVVLEEESGEGKSWKVYLINLQPKTLETTLLSSRGYGTYKDVELKTSVFRHSLGDIPPKSYLPVEVISEDVFVLNNEFFLSYYQDGIIYDKKYIFLPESIVESNFIKVPLVNKPGVMIR